MTIKPLVSLKILEHYHFIIKQFQKQFGTFLILHVAC